MKGLGPNNLGMANELACGCNTAECDCGDSPAKKCGCGQDPCNCSPKAPGKIVGLLAPIVAKAVVGKVVDKAGEKM